MKSAIFVEMQIQEILSKEIRIKFLYFCLILDFAAKLVQAYAKRKYVRQFKSYSLR